MKLPRVITHENMQPLLDQLQQEPEFQIGSRRPARADDWYRRQVILEVPLGELAEDAMKSLALLGRADYTVHPLDGRENFSAQGLEGKARIRKELFSALMNLRDLLSRHRGRILTRDP